MGWVILLPITLVRAWATLAAAPRRPACGWPWGTCAQPWELEEKIGKFNMSKIKQDRRPPKKKVRILSFSNDRKCYSLPLLFLGLLDLLGLLALQVVLDHRHAEQQQQKNKSSALATPLFQLPSHFHSHELVGLVLIVEHRLQRHVEDPLRDVELLLVPSVSTGGKNCAKFLIF